MSLGIEPSQPFLRDVLPLHHNTFLKGELPLHQVTTLEYRHKPKRYLNAVVNIRSLSCRWTDLNPLSFTQRFYRPPQLSDSGAPTWSTKALCYCSLASRSTHLHAMTGKLSCDFVKLYGLLLTCKLILPHLDKIVKSKLDQRWGDRIRTYTFRFQRPASCH